MIKKISAIMMIIAITMFISLSIRASDIETTYLNITSQFNVWTLEENGGVYYIQSNRVLNSAESIEIQLDTVFASSDSDPYYIMENAFVPSYDSETTRITVYNTSTSNTILDTYDFTYEAYEATESMFLNSGTMADPTWSASFDIGNYYNLSIVLDENLTSDQRNRILAVFNNGGAWGSMIPGETYMLDIVANVVTQYLDPTLPVDLALLPETSGSIFDEVNQMADVSIDLINNYEVDLAISYDTIYHLRYTFTSNTDMSIFNNNYEAFYYTYQDQHFIVLNHGTQSLFKSSNVRVQAFIPYTIWNLDTNELVEHNQINVYLHMKLGDANHIVGYFYVDDFVIDRLLQVSAVFNYRWDPLIGSKSDWITQSVILEDTTTVNPSVAWQLDAAASSVTATTALAILGVSGIGLPIFLVGTAVSAYFVYVAADYDGSLISGATSEITLANPSATLLNEINQSYIDNDEDLTEIDVNTFPLWKLDFGEFNKFGNTAEVDSNSVDIITLSYMTDGKIYVLDADKINTNITVDEYLDPNNDSTLFNPTGTNSPLEIPWYYWALGAIVGYIIFKEAKLDKKPGLLIIILIVAYYLLSTFGIL